MNNTTPNKQEQEKKLQDEAIAHLSKIYETQEKRYSSKEEILLMSGFIAGRKTTSTEVKYQINFGNHLMGRVRVVDNKIEIEWAVDGWGNGIPIDQIEITPSLPTNK